MQNPSLDFPLLACILFYLVSYFPFNYVFCKPAQWPFATKKCEFTYFLSTHLKITIEINYLLLFF